MGTIPSPFMLASADCSLAAEMLVPTGNPIPRTFTLANAAAKYLPKIRATTSR